MTLGLRAKFDRIFYSPADQAEISIYITNTGFTSLYISDILIQFDYAIYTLSKTANRIITPQTNAFLGKHPLPLPENVVGRRLFKIKFRIQEGISGYWQDRGFHQTSNYSFIIISPKPWYRVFVSRSTRTTDVSTGNAIKSMIEDWGFQTITVGIEVKVSDEEIPGRIKEEIRGANGVIAILTPRILDSITNLWKTLEWAHNEVGIAFGIDKPLLILKDRRVEVSGLPSFLKQQGQALFLEYDNSKLDHLRYNLALLIPTFRQWIENQNSQALLDTLRNLTIGGLALFGGWEALRRIMGWLEDSS
jgi:hypothetical protein